MKCNHKEIDKAKGRQAWRCDKCGKVIFKGKVTPNRAFGKPKWSR